MRHVQTQRGVVLVTALLVVSVAAVYATAGMTVSTSEVLLARRGVEYAQAFQLAEGALDTGLRALPAPTYHNMAVGASIALPNMPAGTTVTATRQSPTHWRLLVTELASGVQLEAIVWRQNPPNWPGAVYAGEDGFGADDATFDHNVLSNGPIGLNQTTVNGHVISTSDQPSGPPSREAPEGQPTIYFNVEVAVFGHVMTNATHRGAINLWHPSNSVFRDRTTHKGGDLVAGVGANTSTAISERFHQHEGSRRSLDERLPELTTLEIPNVGSDLGEIPIPSFAIQGVDASIQRADCTLVVPRRRTMVLSGEQTYCAVGLERGARLKLDGGARITVSGTVDVSHDAALELADGSQLLAETLSVGKDSKVKSGAAAAVGIHHLYLGHHAKATLPGDVYALKTFSTSGDETALTFHGPTQVYVKEGVRWGAHSLLQAASGKAHELTFYLVEGAPWSTGGAEHFLRGSIYGPESAISLGHVTVVGGAVVGKQVWLGGTNGGSGVRAFNLGPGTLVNWRDGLPIPLSEFLPATVILRAWRQLQ